MRFVILKFSLAAERIPRFAKLAVLVGACLTIHVLAVGCRHAEQVGGEPNQDAATARTQDERPFHSLSQQPSGDDSAKIDSTDGYQVFKRLVSYTWTDRAPDYQEPFGLCPVGAGNSELRLLANGDFQQFWHPLDGGESILKYAGHWNLQPGPNRQWLVCLDRGERFSVTLFANNRIYLDGWKYPLAPLASMPVAKTRLDMDAIRLPEEVQNRIAVVTSHVWHRGNDVNLERYPATIEFRSDFTFLAQSASGRAFPTGTWYATADLVLANGPPDALAEGQSVVDHGLYLKIEIKSPDQLIIGNAPYVRKERLGSQGTIWRFGGYASPVRVQVDYDLPIRRGVPCQFTVHFHCETDLTIQRFSITRQFDHNYRRADGSIAPVEELAALDLDETLVRGGEAESFTLAVTFPESGDHSYYLNALIQGPTQAWDEREAMTFHVSEPR